MSEIRNYLVELDNYYQAGTYNKLELFFIFLDFMTRKNNHEDFMKELKSYPDDWYLEFREWFEEYYRPTITFDNVIFFRKPDYDLQTLKESLLKIKELTAD